MPTLSHGEHCVVRDLGATGKDAAPSSEYLVGRSHGVSKKRRQSQRGTTPASRQVADFKRGILAVLLADGPPRRRQRRAHLPEPHITGWWAIPRLCAALSPARCSVAVQ